MIRSKVVFAVLTILLLFSIQVNAGVSGHFSTFVEKKEGGFFATSGVVFDIDLGKGSVTAIFDLVQDFTESEQKSWEEYDVSYTHPFGRVWTTVGYRIGKDDKVPYAILVIPF